MSDINFGKKPPISLVPPTFIRQVSKCMEDGAKKRSAYNWRKEPVSAMQLLDKILRHTLDAVDGNDLTEDSKLNNLASAAADIAVYLDALEHGTLIDDRPTCIVRAVKQLANTKKIQQQDKRALCHLSGCHDYDSFACKTEQCKCKKQDDIDLGGS